MEIDGQMIGVTNSQGRARSINGVPPFYIGGLNGQGANNRARANLGVSWVNLNIFTDFKTRYDTIRYFLLKSHFCTNMTYTDIQC